MGMDWSKFEGNLKLIEFLFIGLYFFWKVGIKVIGFEWGDKLLDLGFELNKEDWK